MKCTEIKKLLPDYSVFVSVAKPTSVSPTRGEGLRLKHGGALSRRKRKAIERHLDSCPECMRELSYLEKTASLLDSIPQAEPPVFLWEKVRREILQREQIKTPFWQKIMAWLWWKRIPALATSLAVLILVAGLYFVVWRTPTEQEPTLYAEMEQQTFSYWNTSFADRAALGMLVIETSMEGENDETFR